MKLNLFISNKVCDKASQRLVTAGSTSYIKKNTGAVLKLYWDNQTEKYRENTIPFTLSLQLQCVTRSTQQSLRALRHGIYDPINHQRIPTADYSCFVPKVVSNTEISEAVRNRKNCTHFFLGCFSDTPTNCAVSPKTGCFESHRRYWLKHEVLSQLKRSDWFRWYYVTSSNSWNPNIRLYSWICFRPLGLVNQKKEHALELLWMLLKLNTIERKRALENLKGRWKIEIELGRQN